MARRLRQILLLSVLLALIGFGGYSAGVQLWGQHHYRAAAAAMDKRDFAEAEQHIEACLKIWPNSATTQLRAARIARRANDYVKAEARLSRCKQLKAAPGEIHLERALLLVQQGMLSDILIKSLQDYQQEDAEAAVLVFEALSQGYMQTYRLKELLDCVAAWLERQPNDSLAYLRRGWAYERLEQIQEAQQAYRSALELDPDNETAQLQLGQTLLRAGSPAEAVALFERLNQRQPDNLSIGLGLAEAKSQSGRSEEARETLAKLAAGHPRDPLVLTARGKNARQLGQNAEAENWLRQAVALAPFNFDANYALWDCLRAAGKTTEAQAYHARVEQLEADLSHIKTLARALQQAPADANIRYEMGKTYLRLGNEEQGLRWLNSALQQDPSHQQAQQALAEHLGQTGQGNSAAPPRLVP